MTENYQYTLAMAAIFRDEAPYLKEWIEFHLEVGVEHFYLFDNLSSDHFLEVLQPYIWEGVVELSAWPFEHTRLNEWNEIQTLAYKQILELSRGKVKWLAFLDTDEFLFPTQANTLQEFLALFDDCAGIGVNWQVYGTSRVPKIPDDKLLIEMLTLKLPEDAETNHHIKSIVRPEFVVDCINPHFMIYEAGKFQVNPDKIRFDGAFSPYVQIKNVRINHYTLRDQHFYRTVKLPRRMRWLSDVTECEDWFLNQVSDEAIFRFVPRLKNRRESF